MSKPNTKLKQAYTIMGSRPGEITNIINSTEGSDIDTEDDNNYTYVVALLRFAGQSNSAELARWVVQVAKTHNINFIPSSRFLYCGYKFK